MNLWVIFLTGLTTGGLSCLAVQGGLLSSIIANQKDEELQDNALAKKELKALRKKKYNAANLPRNKAHTLALSFDQLDYLPVTLFLIAKLISHVILGFLLGFLGSKLELSLGVRLAFQGFAAIFMFATAMNLLEVHPIFRHVLIQPPKFIQRRIRQTSKGRAFFTPALLGLLTIFIPCGVTQSMEVLAITSGNPIVGALTMGVFVLGTSPLFAVIGIATAKLSETFQGKFLKIAAAFLIIFAINSFNGILVVLNSPVTIQSLTQPVTNIFTTSSTAQAAPTADGKQEITIEVQNSGYSPNYVQVKRGVPVELKLTSNNVYSCALSFVFQEYGIKTFLAATDSQVFSFTPMNKGKFPFSCSMGMYRGVMEVM